VQESVPACCFCHLGLTDNVASGFTRRLILGKEVVLTVQVGFVIAGCVDYLLLGWQFSVQ